MYSLDLFMYSRLLPLILDCTQTDVNDIKAGRQGQFVHADVLVYLGSLTSAFFYSHVCLQIACHIQY